MAILIGFCLATTIILAGKYSKYDKDNSFYPVILMVIASYYVLFAIMANHSILFELVIAICFVLIAIVGSKKAPVMVGIGLILHGFYDILHVYVYSTSVAPKWWPEFCASVDITLGLWVVYLSVNLFNGKSLKIR